MLCPKELSNYELLRDRNIKERQHLIDAVLKDLDAFKQSVGMCGGKSKVAKCSINSSSPKKRRQSKPLHFQPYYSPPRTRARCGSIGSSRGSSPSSFDEDDDDGDRQPLMLFRFPFQKSKKCLSESSESQYSDSEDEPEVFVTEDTEERSRRSRQQNLDAISMNYSGGYNVSRGRTSSFDPNVSAPEPEDITPSQLANIASRASGKIYNAFTGTTCHQCRQKTMDTKTICRSGECVGIRGMFCGPCLINRYGEDVREALLDSKWMCPPCRGLCNCSICRRRSGKAATGILINIARQRGFDNVKDYLDSLL